MKNKISPETSDSILIEHYLDGNEIALEYIINKHQQKIFNFIYSKVHDRDISEDIFQETFIKVIKTLKNGVYNEEGKFLPWVMRISHNLVIDFFRKNNRIKTINSKEDIDIFQFISDGSPNAERGAPRVERLRVTPLRSLHALLARGQRSSGRW